ncbi:hypothetical protein L1987_63408 [Smallanthus sonchifolius]|uniref:Uncharacterized protein n=1 Tax=Smallanthus sonchifolius TaxID=185202 RepID=A0ACB9CD49_9ASTR|nr:hypothetical protein L1987_63408 [Smallanthus sonchifolius]
MLGTHNTIYPPFILTEYYISLLTEHYISQEASLMAAKRILLFAFKASLPARITSSNVVSTTVLPKYLQPKSLSPWSPHAMIRLSRFSTANQGPKAHTPRLTDIHFERIKTLGYFNSLKKKGGTDETVYEIVNVSALLCTFNTSLLPAAFVEGELHDHEYENMLVRDFYKHYVEIFALKDSTLRDGGYILIVDDVSKGTSYVVRVMCHFPAHRYLSRGAEAVMMSDGELYVNIPFNEDGDEEDEACHF